jgi:ATP-binding cassette subfamily F protein 3
MILLKDISLQRGIKPIFDNASITFYPQHKVGIIGNNGVGKTTLFAMILGSLEPDAGEIQLSNGLRVATVQQEIDDYSLNVLDYVISGYKEFYPLHLEMKDAIAGKEISNYAHKQSQFEEMGGYFIEANAAKLLDGLGFNQTQLTQSVGELSGGWQIRLNLAQALLKPSDVLLLDEPTNHLDIDALVWLEKWLISYQGMILLISHDRFFLDQIVDEILLIENKIFQQYSGNYSRFERLRAEEIELQSKQYEKQQKNIAHLQSFIDRFKAKASKAKQAQSRVKMLERMQKIEAVQQEGSFSFRFPTTKIPSGPLLIIDDADIGYGEKVILSGVKINIVSGMRVGLLGKNGAGKSTLIKSMVENLPLLTGKRVRHDQLSVGYFAQHALESFDEEVSTPLDYFRSVDRKATDQVLRNFLGSFMFSNEMVSTNVQLFSGGEKARLVLASLVYLNPNLLILDEPTNHLDMSMRQALNTALQYYQGALIIVSHDRYLLESTVDNYWLVHDGKVEDYEGDLDQYKKLILDSAKEDKSKDKAPKVSRSNKKEDRQKRAQERAEIKAIKDNAVKLEKKHQLMLEDLKLLEAKFDNDLSASDLADLSKQYEMKKSQAEDVETKWLDAMEKCDNLNMV